MTFQAVPNGRKVELNGVQNGVPVVNVFYVTTIAGTTESDLTVIADEVITWFNGHSATWNNSYTLANVTVTDVSAEDSTQVIVSPPTGGVGTGAGAAEAANAAVCASLRTGRIGRSYRGRFYFGALSTSALADAHTLTPGAVTAFATTITDLIDALAAIECTLVVVSRVAARIVRIIAVATEVISIIVDAKVDSQRRRTAN
jgi:hypothetical protein